MLQKILHEITELQIEVFSGQSLEKTDSKLTEIRNDIKKVINSIAFKEDIANFEKIMNIKWQCPNKNEFPEPHQIIISGDGNPYKVLTNMKVRCLLTNSCLNIKHLECWTYAPSCT